MKRNQFNTVEAVRKSEVILHMLSGNGSGSA